MIGRHYILEGHKVVPCDLIKWATWFETADRHVALDDIGNARISTVFLSLDDNFLDRVGREKPLLFETKIFGGIADEYQERCSTWEEAEAMHAKAVEFVLSQRWRSMLQEARKMPVRITE